MQGARSKWRIVHLQTPLRQLPIALAASLGKWCQCSAPSPPGAATTQTDECKAVSVNVVIGLYLTLSPMFLFTLYGLLGTFNKTNFVCNSNCHRSYYVFRTNNITGNQLHSMVADTWLNCLFRHSLSLYMVNESLIINRIPPNMGLFCWHIGTICWAQFEHTQPLHTHRYEPSERTFALSMNSSNNI